MIKRRARSFHAWVRSTTQRFGRGTKPSAFAVTGTRDVRVVVGLPLPDRFVRWMADDLDVDAVVLFHGLCKLPRVGAVDEQRLHASSLSDLETVHFLLPDCWPTLAFKAGSS